MNDPTPTERPLDNAEARELRRIEKQLRLADPGYAERLGSTSAPTRQGELRWFHVVLVMTATVAFVAATTLLPERVMLPTLAVTLLVVVPLACLVWAARHGDL